MAKKKRSAGSNSGQRSKQDPEIDFEEALADVESIVAKLESGELGLSDSLKQYEIGIKRLKQCHALLQQAERRVTLLTGVDEDGNVSLETFKVDEAAADSGGNRTARKKSVRRQSPEAEDGVDDLPGLF